MTDSDEWEWENVVLPKQPNCPTAQQIAERQKRIDDIKRKRDLQNKSDPPFKPNWPMT